MYSGNASSSCVFNPVSTRERVLGHNATLCLNHHDLMLDTGHMEIPIRGDEWESSLQKHLAKLNSKDRDQLSKRELDYHSLQQSVSSLAESSRRKTLPQYLFKLLPALEHLQIFTQGINSIVQVQSTPLGLIWGCVDMVIAVRFPAGPRHTCTCMRLS